MKKYFKMIGLLIITTIIFIGCEMKPFNTELPFLLEDENNNRNELYWASVTNSGIHFKNLSNICKDNEVEVIVAEGSLFGGEDSLNILFRGKLPFNSSGVTFNKKAAHAVNNVLSSKYEYIIIINGIDWNIGSTNNEFWRIYIQGF